MEETKALGSGPEVGHFVVFKDKAEEKSPPFYADLYKAEGKRGGAWRTTREGPPERSTGKIQTPIAYLVFRYSSALLSVINLPLPTLNDVETLFPRLRPRPSTTCFTKQTDLSDSGIAEWNGMLKVEILPKPVYGKLRLGIGTSSNSQLHTWRPANQCRRNFLTRLSRS